MDYIEKHKSRINLNGEIEDLGDAYKQNTISFIESTFHASPTFRKMTVKSVEKPHITEMDARVVEIERMGTLREVLFRPTSEGLNEGSIVNFDGHNWLIFDKFGQNKVLVEQCNRKIKWYDKEGKLNDFDCIASAQDLGSKAKQGKNEIEFNKYDVSLPTGQLFVFVELRPETEKINLGHRFIFGKKAYEVTGYDDTTLVREVNDSIYGVLQLTVKVAMVKEEDDFDNRIAHNLYDGTSTLAPSEGDSSIGQGGSIW